MSGIGRTGGAGGGGRIRDDAEEVGGAAASAAPKAGDATGAAGTARDREPAPKSSPRTPSTGGPRPSVAASLLEASLRGVPPGAQPIAQALGAGKASDLAPFLGPRVALTLPGLAGEVDKRRATTTLRDFFAAHPAKSFSVLHSGTSRGGGSNYIVGNLTTEKGTFRATILLRKEGGEPRIADVRIEPN